MFGTNEKFRLKRGGFTRTGNAFFIDEDYETDTLRLTNYKPSSMVLTSPYLFALKLVSEGKELAYTYFADAGSLKMDCEKGWAQFAMTDNEQVRFRGKGVTLRIELSPAIKTDGTKACDGVYTRPDGSIEGVFGTYGKLLFHSLKGRLIKDCPWSDELGRYERVVFEFEPDSSGEFEGVIIDNMIELPQVSDFTYPPFDDLVKANYESFAEFKKNYLPPAKGYENLYEYTAYFIWTHRNNGGGGWIEPSILFQLSLASAMSWQQSYHAAAMINNPKEAWRLICYMFLHQDPKTGQLPSGFGYSGPGTGGGVQPPMQGFAFEYLINKSGDDSFLTPAECERMYPKMVKWAEFWLKYRASDRGDDVPEIYNPNDSGWDDASIFKDGFPAQSPDLIALLILYFEMLGRIAKGCGKMDESENWYERSKKLLKTLIDEFWDGEKFITKSKGKPVDSMSLISYQPIILAKRLPQDIIDICAQKLTEEGHFLTEIGLATESLRSPLCDYGSSTFISGRVVAPPHMFITAGLNQAGKKKEAALIARRWCDNVQEKGVILGFAPYEYYKLTGKKANVNHGPVASDGWAYSGWAAACTMMMITTIIPEEND